MTGKIFFNALAALGVVLTLAAHVTGGATFSRIDDASLSAMDAHFPEDLGYMLRRAPFHEARVFEVARKYIQDMEASPPCHQLATSTLIDSCQSFSSIPGQDSTRTTDQALDEVRQEYAARLAVCELQGIKSGIPGQCAPFVPSRQACPRTQPRGFFSRKNASSQEESKRACYPDFTPQQLKQCVDALFDHGQRWTSYSNAQTNAIVICQASRGALENEEHLHKLKEAVQSQASVSESLFRAVQETEDRLARHHDFAKAVHGFQSELYAHNEAALAQADSTVARLVGKFDSAAEAMLGVFTRSFKTATSSIDDLNSAIKGTNSHIDEARTALQVLHDEAVRRDSARSAAQDLSLKDNQALAADLQLSLENVRDITVLALIERLQGVEATMVQYIGAQKQALEDQQTFQQTQTRIIENQLIIETSLSGQHIIIEEHSQKIREMSFGGLGGIIASWTGLALCIILLSRFSLILAASVACGAGVAGALDSTTVSDRISSTGSLIASAMTISEHTVLFSALLILVVGSAISLGIMAGSILLRRQVISGDISNPMLDIEAPKREPSS